ncbi:MAG: biopolymer transporter ExbD [Acidiferrobacterales bacterium]|jgi:biopolymer transport protein ExbD|nr:biopolymer transporter ExbD [Acidiferrobacterales bacterium]
MKTTRRMKRMSRGRAKKMPGFNLVSLMDIFTILVFFLLVNSAQTQDLPSTEQVKLPESISEKKPEETAVVMVTETEVLVQNKVVANRADVEASKAIYVPAIRDELLVIAQSAVGISGKEKTAKKEVTIMGDRAIPFKLLKKIMSSCTAAGYETINLAVIQKASQFKKESS